MGRTASPKPNPNDRLGLLFCITSSLGLGLAMVVSRFAYDGGANGLALGTARALLFVPAVLLFCQLTGRTVLLPFRDWLQCAGLGLFMAMGFYGHVGAIEYISIGLAAVLFFTFPPLIAVLQALVAKEPPGLAKSFALAVSFSGLALMLGVSLGSADPRGLALGLGAGLCIAWNIFWTGRRVPHLDGVVAAFHMGVVALVVMVSVSLLSGKVSLPSTTTGWVGLACVAGLQTLSMPLFYLALPRIGSLKVGMLSNVQPVFSIILAYLVFGELMSVAQLTGGGMVLAGIWLMQRQDRHR